METVVRAENPATRLTEGPEDDVQSVCQILVPLVCLPRPGDATDDIAVALNSYIYPAEDLVPRHSGAMRGALPKVALSLMGEAISRACRRIIHKDTEIMWSILQRTLGISPDSCRDVLPDNQVEPAQDDITHSGHWDLKVDISLNIFTIAALNSLRGRLLTKPLRMCPTGC